LREFRKENRERPAKRAISREQWKILVENPLTNGEQAAAGGS
jgi:hypothetical protein